MNNAKIKKLAKELCHKSGCHHLCRDTDKCIVEEEAEEIINNLPSTLTNEEKVSEKEKQIEEMIEIVKPFVSGLACEQESGSCELTDCRNCNARDLSNKLYNAGYRKQSEGEWIMERTPSFYHYYTCSVCGWDFCREDSRIDEKSLEGSDLRYCPKCGARMKGGEPDA